MFVIPFDSSSASLARVGGKGANLARLARAGFAVPPGFLITTAAYQHFVQAHALAQPIADALAALGDARDSSALDAASQAIGAAFTAAPLPPELAQSIVAAWRALNAPAVAVRSSATAEDLPDHSFAGQQDTYLNVVGEDELLRAVVACFASLWTARAIGYRARNGVDHSEVALAVVVQAMVQSETSGVLFTANPLTGRRDETVINATWGLGEALVAGQVEPDQYVVETATGAILTRTQGAKAVAIRSRAGGGVERVEGGDGAPRWSLTDTQVRELVRLGDAVVAAYGGAPQDLEWARADGKLYLLQARPITSLFPLPPGLPADPPALLFSFGAVQGMQDPMTPLGQEAFRTFSAAFARLWGFDFAPGQVPAIHFAAERMWIRFDALLRNKATRRAWMTVFPLIEAGARDDFLALANEAGHVPTRAAPTPETLRRLRHFISWLELPQRLAATAREPERTRKKTFDVLDDHIARLQREAGEAKTLTERVAFVRRADANFAAIFLPVLPNVVVAMASYFNLARLARRAGVPETTSLALLRGLPHNVTTEMDLALWQVARTIQNDPAARATVESGDAAALAQQWLARSLPAVAQAELDAFLGRYGVRGLAEIDMGRARWVDNPTQVLQMVQNYLLIDDPTQAPDAVFARSAQAAEEARREVVAAIHAKSGPAAARLADALAVRTRALVGLRELPKFTVIRIMGVLRGALFTSFRELAAAGVLEAAADGVFLTLDELLALDAGYAIDWKALVRARKELYAREQRRTLVPRLMAGDGRVFYGGVAAPAGAEDVEGTLHGSPVSPGTVEGTVHVVFDPHGARLEPGEILVCPGTDPAWTPLFLTAGGLVMEVGGLMTHGSVVAREYGIPAVVGVARATQRLQTGMRIRVDGASGLIQLLDGGAHGGEDSVAH